jgi:hypothetical protein
VEHRHDWKNRVQLADAEGIDHPLTEGVQHDRTMGINHSLRAPGRARRVTHRGCFVFRHIDFREA